MGDYEVIPGEEKILGEGCFGRVKKIFACKSIRFREEDTSKKNVEREFVILKRLNHPNIVKFVDFVWCPRKAKLYMEYCNGGTLTDLIQVHKNSGIAIPETYVWNVVQQLASALAYCHHGLHENAAGALYTPIDWPEWDPIIHRDIKPSNVLISKIPDTNDAIVKLGDFGLGRVLREGTLASTYAGTPLYRPPEISYTDDSDIRWTEKCDVFSLGCTLYALCMLKPPFDRHMVAKSPVPRTIFDMYSESLRRSITTCLSIKPELRPNILNLVMISKRQVKGKIGIGGALNIVSSEAPGGPIPENVVKDGPIHESISISGHAEVATNGKPTSEKMIFEDLTLPQTSESHDTNIGVHSEEFLSTAFSEVFSSYGTPSSMRTLYENLVDCYWNESRFHDLRETSLKIPEHMSFDQFNEAFGEMNRFWFPSSVNSSKETLLDLYPGYGYSARSLGARRLGRTLCLAILMGDVKIVQFLLKEGVDVHFQDQLRLSGHNSWAPSQNVTFVDPPLVLAALTKNKAILQMLIKNGADVNRSDPATGRTALHHAAYEADTKMLELLLDSGAEKELEDNEGRMPLHCATYGIREDTGACQAANLPAMTLLLGRGANLEARTKDGFTPLHTAVYTYQEEATELLLEQGASIHAKTREDKSVLDFLFVRYIKPKTGIDQFSVFALLLKHGAFDDNREGRTRLQNAVIFQKAAYVKLILEYLRGPDVLTSMRQHVDARDVLGRTALHHASKGTRADILQYLIEAGADVNAQDSKMRRPVHHAAATPEGLSCLKELILARRGADINAAGKSNITALHLVAQWDTRKLLYIWEDGDIDEKELEVTEALDFMLKAGADIHARTTTGANALCLAAKKGNMEIMEALLKAGTPPSKRDSVREAALRWAKTNRGPPAAEMVDLYEHESVAKAELAADRIFSLYWKVLLTVTLVAFCIFFGNIVARIQGMEA